jgi:alkaline phosphatase
MRSETHGGEDVPVYAQGPWSHLFIGTMEQHTIAHKMAYAACWGDYINRDGCKSHGIHSNRRLTFTKICILMFSYFYFVTITPT